MKRRRCIVISSLADLPAAVTEKDRAEIEKFADYLRRVGAAKQAGVPHDEAARAIYPDVYPEDEKT
jgi:hypothetical protein